MVGERVHICSVQITGKRICETLYPPPFSMMGSLVLPCRTILSINPPPPPPPHPSRKAFFRKSSILCVEHTELNLRNKQEKENATATQTRTALLTTCT